MRLNKENIADILRRRIANCNREEIAAILEMCGFAVKEFSGGPKQTPGGQYSTVSFEVHYSFYYIIRVEAESNVRAVGYHNEYLQDMGISTPTDNMAELVSMLIDFWMPRFPYCNYEGPVYHEDRNNEYESLEDMQSVLEIFQEEYVAVMNENVEAEQKRKQKPAIEVGTGKVKDMLAGLVGGMDDRKMRIFIEAINGMPVDGAMTKVSGVKSEDGQTLYGTDEDTVLTWDEFLESVIKVGNIKVN